MSFCAQPPANAPLIKLMLVGTGEPLLRMEKRLSCAAVGLGIRLEVEISKDADELGIPSRQTPAVLHNSTVIIRGLRRTEEIEEWLESLI